MPKIHSVHKRRIRRSVAIVGVVCFAVVAVFSATLLMVLAGHEHEGFAGCPRTLNPQCACESDAGPAASPAMAIALAGARPHIFNGTNETKADCLACVLMQKVVDPLRQTVFAAGAAALADAGLFASAALCILFLLTASPSPVELKTKITN
jgi:hypothetical protein